MKKGYYKYHTLKEVSILENKHIGVTMIHSYHHCKGCDSRWETTQEIVNLGLISNTPQRYEYDYCDDCKEKEV